MADHFDDDELLARLRAADPVDPRRLPSPTSASASADLLREITVTDTAQPTERPSRTGPGLRPLLIGAAAAVALLAGIVALATGGDDGAETATTETTVAGVDPGGISPSGGLAMCVEMYDLTTLANREVAFDGVVQSVSGDSVTFSVNEAFRGVDGSTITLEGAGTIGGLTSVGDALSLEPGTRLLVAGDGGFAWSCGFTQPYDEAVAAEWAAALS
jgi:hypothetical protein